MRTLAVVILCLSLTGCLAKYRAVMDISYADPGAYPKEASGGKFSGKIKMRMGNTKEFIAAMQILKITVRPPEK